MFPKTKLLSAIVAGAVITTYAAIPNVHADEHKHAESKASSESMSSQKNAEEKARAEGKAMQSALQDAWLDGKLETTLLLTDELNSFAIDTEIKNGVAYLSGTVESDVDRDLAEEIAQSIDGVDSVKNELKVEEKNSTSAEGDSETAADERFRTAVGNAVLTARIKSELLVNSNTSGLSIDVDSTQNAVMLSGSVDSEASKELAEQIAQNAAGEREVKNNLRVEANS